MIGSYLSHQARVNEAHRRYSTARYKILTKPDRNKRVIDFVMDDRGIMRKVVLDEKGRMRYEPIGDGKRFIDFCHDGTGKMKRVVLNEQIGKVEFEPLEARI